MECGRNIIEYSKYEAVEDFQRWIEYGKEVDICYKFVDNSVFY